MYLRLIPNLLHFLPDLDAFYALRHALNFYEIHPGYLSCHLSEKLLASAIYKSRENNIIMPGSVLKPV
jgi:hypothetical protein